ncbi:hypothetical protein FQZ97_549600 [compost metagenome]
MELKDDPMSTTIPPGSYYIVEVIGCVETVPSLELACHIAKGLGIRLEQIGQLQRSDGDFALLLLWDTAPTMAEAQKSKQSYARWRGLDPVRLLGELSPPEIILDIQDAWEPIAHSVARTLQ